MKPKYSAKQSVVSMPLVLVKEGERKLVTAVPQEIFRGNRLLISGAVGKFFLIHDFKIGLVSQLVCPGPIPAAAFSEEAVGVRMEMDTCMVGQTISLDVEHVKVKRPNFIVRFLRTLFGTAQDWEKQHVFSGVVVGDSLQYEYEAEPEAPQEPPVN